MSTTIEGAIRLTDEREGARKQRERTRARVLEIARAQGGMDDSLEAVLVFLHMEEFQERQGEAS